MQITKHFSLDEMKCKDGTTVPKKDLTTVKALFMCLERIRAEFGKPIKIISGYRTVSYNKKCGGTQPDYKNGKVVEGTGSRHLYSMAADIVIDGVKPGEVSRKIRELIDEGAILQGGVGLYPGRFVHYDIRGTAARWEN